MRSGLFLLLAAPVAAGCSIAPPAARSPAAQAHLESMLAGKVAGAPVDCIPSSVADDMVVIDDGTLIFRDGSKRVWRNDLNGRTCYGLRTGGTLVTKRGVGTSSLCRGDVNHVITSGGMPTSTCIMGPFVPYSAPGS